MRPECKASYARTLLSAVDAQPGVCAALIRRRTPREAITRIEGAHPNEWIPFEHYQALAEAVRAELGDAGNRRFWRGFSLANFSSPLLRHITEGAVRVFGLSPAAFMQLASRVRDLMVRGCGTLTYEPGDQPNSGRLVLDDFPREHFASGTSVELLAATFDAFFEVAKVHGTVTVLDQDPARGRAVFVLRWR